MSKFIENQEKNFKKFSILPGKLRAMVIGEMPIDDRCRFSGASLLCNTEAKASENFSGSLTFEYQAKEKVGISVNSGYSLEFFDAYGIKFMEYSTSNRKKYVTLLDPSTNLVEKASEHFKELLKRYQKSIKALTLFKRGSGQEMLSNMGITGMDKLEDLIVCGDFDYQQFVRKAKNPLKKLMIVNNWRSELSDKIYEIKDVIYADNLKINREQFAKLSARKITIPIGLLTVQDVFNIIRSWQEGTLGREVTEFTWKLHSSNFDVSRLIAHLEGKNGVTRISSYKMTLPHHIIIGKSATLYYMASIIKVKFQN